MRHISLCLLIAAGLVSAEQKIQSNVVYGMYSGSALLMDVHLPDKPNGYGIVFISGSGWTTPMAYGSWELKSNKQSKQYAAPLVAAGYVVFTLNHRSLPRFRYPDPVRDVQRAVRFIRNHAGQFGIRADRIGAAGGSSGGHLVSLLGTLDGNGNPADPDPVERESAKVQCVVARAAPSNFLTFAQAGIKLLGMALPVGDGPEEKASIEYRTHVEASPVSHISKDDPPFLLLHGDRDETVPVAQSLDFEKALRTAGVKVKLIQVAGGGHGPTFPGAVNPPDYMGAMVAWFDGNLKAK